MAINNSYEFQNKVRDLAPMFQKLIASQPTLLSLITVGVAPQATKHEWLEEQLAPTSSAIASFDTDGDGTGINVASTSGFKAGDIVRTTSSTGVTQSEVMRIVSVDSATDLTVSRDYGGSTGVTLDVGDIVVLVASPKQEATDASATDGGQAGTNYNYTQIEDDTAKVSKTAQLVKIYGVENMLTDQVERKMVGLMRRINNSLIHGRRVERDGSNVGSAAGILQFLEGGNVTNVAGAVTAVKINDALEAIFDDGGYSNNYALVCAENQARKISAFNTSSSNPVIQQGSQVTGGYISEFRGDIPVQTGFTAKVVVDPNFPKDQIAVVDLNRVEINYLRAMTDEDATPAGADYFQRRMLTEFTFTVRDGQKAHALLTGLTL